MHFRLIWLRDICELTQKYQAQIDWEAIVENARHLKLCGPIHSCFQCATNWLNAPIPQKVLSELKASCSNNRIERKAHNCLTHVDEDTTGITHHFYKYLSVPGLAGKGLYLLGAMFPGVTYLRNRYKIPESKTVCLYYLYRTWFILYSATSALIKLITRRVNRY